jgi:hypothetical protein
MARMSHDPAADVRISNELPHGEHSDVAPMLGGFGGSFLWVERYKADDILE